MLLQEVFTDISSPGPPAEAARGQGQHGEEGDHHNNPHKDIFCVCYFVAPF